MHAVLRRLGRPAASACLVLAFAVPSAQAALFGDDEARRAILELRQRFDQLTEQQRVRQAEHAAQQAEAARQIEQLRRSLLDLNNQLELQRAEAARIRGQNEQLARDLAEVQRRQSDIQKGIDDRIRRIEPQKIVLDDKEFLADPEEKRLYEDSVAAFRRSEFDGAAAGMSTLLRRWPNSGYRELALFWLGNAQYGKREYKEAITSFRTLIGAFPESPRAAESMLAIANSQAELKDTKSARRTLEELVRLYPRSEAAHAGRERLVTMK